MGKLFLTTVGTSYFTKMREKLLEEKFKETLKEFSMENLKQVEEYLIDYKTYTRDNYEKIKEKIKSDSFEDCAEISTLKALYEKGILDKNDKVLLVCGEDTHIMADDMKKIIEKKFQVKVEIKDLKLEIKDLNSFKSLWEFFTKAYDECIKAGDELILVSSGGYKIISDLSYLFSLIYEVPDYYLYDGNKQSNQIYKLPDIPVNWDYISFVSQSPALMGQEVDFLANIIREKSNEIKEHLLYSDPVIKRIPIRNKTYRDILKKNMPIWQNLWIGDLIPETVEHSKSHSKRILQRFEILLSGMKNKEAFFESLDISQEGEKDRYLFYLYTSAYLHDIGHTVMSAKWGNGVVDFSVLPEVVREYHNILSVYELETNELLGLDEIDKDDLTAIKLICLYHRKKMNLAEKMEVNNSDEKEKFGIKLARQLLGDFEVDVPMIENKKFKSLPDNIKKITLQVAGMLKLLDELDVQADRVVDNAYMKVRMHRTTKEAERILGKISNNERKEQFKSILDEIKNKCLYDDPKFKEIRKNILSELYRYLNNTDDYEKIDEDLKLSCQFIFKVSQFMHFKKHASIKSVLPIYHDIGLKIEVRENSQDEYSGSMDCKKDIEDQIKKLKEDQECLKKNDLYKGLKLLPVECADECVVVVRE